MEILKQNEITFKSLEEIILKISLEIGKKIFVEVLEAIDQKLCAERNTKVYRDKGARKTVIKTLMGEVEFSRKVYGTKTQEGKTGYVYLLDEALGCDGIGQISELLGEKIAEACCDMPYRKAAETISAISGQSISATCAWNVIQRLGERIQEKDKQQAKLASRHESKGEEKAKLLFEEQDGVYLRLQGADRKKHQTGKEMKVAIAYTGASKTYRKTKASNPRYNLKGKVAYAGFASAPEFQRRKEGVIGERYDLNEVDMRILNGDGAEWIKSSQVDDTVHYQLDPYHRNKAVIKYVHRKEIQDHIFKLLYAGEIDECIDVIEIYADSMADEDEGNNLRKLHSYFKNNRQGLLAYKERGLDLPQPREGENYRTCGAMESNIFSIIGSRMKGRRACWSINGGNNLARLLCFKATRELSKRLESMASVLPEQYSDEITTVLSAAKAPQKEGHGYDVFTSSQIPMSYKWLKKALSTGSLL